MFIEKLWEENPKRVERAVKSIFSVREDWGDGIEFKKIEDNALVFIRYGRVREKIYLGDFWVSTVRSTPYKANNECALKWVKFMYNVYGDKYALQYIAYRNRELDKFMAEYEEKFNRETRKVLDEMGFGKSQSQIK